MNKLYFCNNGDFDVRAMLTFGVSAKDKQDAVGFFGTGFKYAVSIILRNGGKISVITGGKGAEFTVKRETIRGKDFDLVYFAGSQAGFTTHLGVNWAPWMAFRELYCNTMDESGIVTDDIDEAIGYDTIIEIHSNEIYSAWTERHQFMLESDKITESNHIEIHQGAKNFIFYRGNAVFATDRPTLYGYNIKSSIDLTEDRTAKHEYQVRFALKRCLQNLKDKRLIREILTSEQECLETNISWDIDFGYSQEFAEVLRELMLSGHGLHESARVFLSKIDEKLGNWPEFEPSNIQKAMISKSLDFLRSIGVNADQYPILTVDGLGGGVMGRAMNKTIYLSRVPFDMGTKQVAGTILEEWLHNSTGCKDFDRQMQNWLFDKILSIGEELNGQPL